MAKQSPQHIILLGITQRCGTNYLFSLLGLHQEIQSMDFPGEDFLLKSSEHLGRYVHGTSSNWHAMWGGGISIPDYQKKLFNDIGKGLISNFLQDQTQNSLPHLLSKTPDTHGVAWAPVLFPDSKIIFLVRNPVSTIASGRKSFGWTYSESMKRWKASADRIQSMLQRYPQQCLLVRYEDLMDKKEETISTILDFVGLDQEGFRFGQIDEIKILGSSKSRNTEGKIDWSGEATRSESVPLTQKSPMPDWLQSYILEKCNKQYRALGYQKPAETSRIGIFDKARYAIFIIPDLVKDLYRGLKQSTTSSNSSFQKWCKNHLGLEIETHS